MERRFGEWGGSGGLSWDVNPMTYVESMMNITTTHIAKPANAVCQLNCLNFGRKFGVPVIFSTKHARLVIAYDSRNSMDLRATWCLDTKPSNHQPHR